MHSIAAAFASTESTAAERDQAIEYRKAPFLILVKALVERICGVGQFLQGRTGVRHGCGALTQALDRILARATVAHCADALHAQLAQVARGLLECRPVLLLLRREQQSRF